MKKSLKIAITAAVLGIMCILGIIAFSPKSKAIVKKEILGSASQDANSESSSIDFYSYDSFQSKSDLQPFTKFDPRIELENYKEWAKYPPNSRPLHSGQLDLLDPFNAKTPAMGVAVKPAQCKTNEKGIPDCKKPILSDIRCALTPNKSISVGKIDFKVFLFCATGKDKPDKPLILNSLTSKVYIRDGIKLKPTLPPIAFGDDGKNGDEVANDQIYTIMIRPTESDWGYMHLDVEFTVNGMKHIQRATWFSTPQKVAEFRPGIVDMIRNGHLILAVPIKVYKPGFYRISANLLAEESKKPIASSTFEDELEVGDQKIELEFFGKILHDKDQDGPYLVQSLRGLRVNLPITPTIIMKSLKSGRPVEAKEQNGPEVEYFAPYPEEYVTEKYNATSFSKEEWKSEEKNLRMQYLEGLKGD